MGAYLNCTCGSREFIRWARLKKSEAGGTVEEVGGWQCANPECLAKADTGEMLRRVDLEAKVKELRELTQEIQNATPAKQPDKPEAKGTTAEAAAKAV